MRLICPNCGAQYEVPDDVIPDMGRDVQCSNCGDTWFQHHPDNDPDLQEELIASGLVEQPIAEGVAVPDTAVAPVPPEAAEPEIDNFAEMAEDDLAPRRRELDPSIAEVLREEAEREARARAAEATPLESQPDLGLTPPEDAEERRARQVRERMARMRGEPDDATAGDAPTPEPEELEESTPTSRRDLLPDIDEINSSLRPAAENRPAAADDHDLLDGDDRALARPNRGGSGFRRGFALALMLTAILWALYSFAPRISASVPALAPVMMQYTSAIDGARAALDDQVRQLLINIQAESGS
ncbi:zinc-ribbon domain-containing protein [Thalassobius sp. Cn5-15]|uniref:zinc-ribbon domain-containing protein n=1 Tax=Thalassobius sp. Cn5-15 TaxID=2917763 RepID=UPI001EF19A5A|nr:zinc-ribbon domain-containing protein [Thalassobius sp. Cn5-15]MCG7493659.1 zinc-ribbon domain-containing protein [Thalassobius sp. Cn5-15]